MTTREITLDALKSYYKTLSVTGYLSTYQVKNLLVLSFLDDIFENYSEYITDKDYNMLLDIFNCISNQTCTVKYFQRAIHTLQNQEYIRNTPLKISQEGELSATETSILRTISK